MTNIADKKYEIIKVDDKIHFHGHDFVLNECFGAGIKKYGHQKALWRPDGIETWEVWFPKILRDKNEHPKATDSGWVNSISIDGITISERLVDMQKEDYWPIEGFAEDLIRLVFAYDCESEDYIFRGAFVGNNEATEGRNHIFTRIATEVRLLGNPVYGIELIDKDSSLINKPHKFEGIPEGEIKIVEPLDIDTPIEEQEEHAAKMDADSLRAAAKKREAKHPVKEEKMVPVYKRDAYIAEDAKQRANGICQLCKQKAPFIDKKGKPYLECHHVIWISQGGADAIENTVALCPNCHRKMHNIASQEDVDYLLKVAKEK